MSALPDPPPTALAQPWIERAACKGIGTSTFFVEAVQEIREAQEVCERCPVKRECLDYAIEANCTFGVYGGLSHRQRRSILAAGYWPGKDPQDYMIFLSRPSRR